MARSFSYDPFRETKRDDRSALRRADRAAFTQNRPPTDNAEGPLHGRGPQAETREHWKELNEGPHAEREGRAAAEARATRVPIGALPPSPPLAEGTIAEGAEGRAPRRGLPRETLVAEARVQWGVLHRSLGDAFEALAHLLKLPVGALRRRQPEPE